MAENTEISWADDTFNPWEGCQKVSPACDGCYAEARNLRYAPKGSVDAPNWGPGAPRRRTSKANWAKPLKWEREVAAIGGPRFVFCASLADVFDNAVPAEWRRDLFDLIGKTPHLTWLLLTKRPQNIVSLFMEAVEEAQPMRWESDAKALQQAWPRNAYVGTSIEDRKRLGFNAEALAHAKRTLGIPMTFWSCEPLLEDLGDISGYLEVGHFSGVRGVDWVITGGETDQGKHKARPSHPDWFRSLRDQCATAGVAYHHKQNGEWAPGVLVQRNRGIVETASLCDDKWFYDEENLASYDGHVDDEPDLYRIGKKAAGRMLDGVIHDARPTVRA